MTENLFYEGQIIENNSFGKFSKQSTIEIIESIKSENELVYLLKNFSSSNNKNLLVLRFSENNLNKINSVHYIINNYEKENQTNKVIILMIHRQRKLKTKINKKLNNDLISFINDDYYQLFIDNLHGKENLDIFTIITSKSEQLAKLFINETNFIENKIYMILSYMKINLKNETDEFNKENCTNELRKNIIKNKSVLKLIINNLELQSTSINGIINEVFTSNQFEVNDVDFFEDISSKLNKYFCTYLFNIIFHSLKENIMLPILINDNCNILMQNQYFKKLITDEFNKKEFNFACPLKMAINANQILIFNGFNLPKSKCHLDKIIKYFNDNVYSRFVNNEEILRKNYSKEKAKKMENKYYNELEQISNNLKVEIIKDEYLELIYSKKDYDVAKLLLYDYLNYFILKYLEKNEFNDFRYNEKY